CAYGEIMLNEKRVYRGPVYSEGRQHWYYCGLTDGNYAQDPSASLPVSPWLVDFDLRKLHPLCCNFGMGNLEMFYGRGKGLGETPAERDTALDRFLAATVAFGHTGFLVREGGIASAARSYFMLQQLQKHYAQQRVVSIRYAAHDGTLLDTSAAVASGVHARSQLAVRYDNGLLVAVNGHPAETWHFRHGSIAVDLPPNGYVATFPRNTKSKLWVMSALRDGHRVDYADTPEYVYADGRGVFTRFEKVACDGPVVVHPRAGGALEVIPVRPGLTFGVRVAGSGATATALNKEGKAMGAAQTRFSRGLVYVTPVDQAFSYLLKPGAPTVTLTCPRERVVPGEEVVVRGEREHPVRVPADLRPRTRWWYTAEGGWIDFSVVPLAETRLSVVGDDLQLHLRANTAGPVSGHVSLGDETRQVTLDPRHPALLHFSFRAPAQEGAISLTARLRFGELTGEKRWWLRTERVLRPVVPLPARYDPGQCLRGGEESGPRDDTGGYVSEQSMSCGGETRQGIFMHPPYKTGVGYTFVRFAPVALPSEPAAAFRCLVGKRDGSDLGDGILFRVVVIDEKGKRTVVAEKQWARHAWTPLEGGLSPWAGRTIRLQLESDVGPADNSSGDWACWADLRIENAEPMAATTVEDGTAAQRYAAGPYRVPGLTLEQIRRAPRAWLVYQSVGLEHHDPYICTVTLNGVPVGDLLPGEGSDEVKGVWSREAALPLPPEAIAALRGVNRVAIANPGQDHFKVRGFRLDVEMADGRRTSSLVDTMAYTQPDSWLYAEGVGVPFGRAIEVVLPFELAP
ncbi:MAG: hypothetical protein QHJ73_09730, partial [Armatimonadota bacterium]|nr:hypothetical protein [Armatimonadota bacterium]